MLSICCACSDGNFIFHSEKFKHNFTTAAGIHQGGITENRLNYSFFDPKLIRRNFEFAFNKIKKAYIITGVNDKIKRSSSSIK
jgi:hypothetical protein